MSTRKRTMHSLRKLRQGRMDRRPTDQGHKLSLKREAMTTFKRKLYSRESRHLLGLEKLYDEGRAGGSRNSPVEPNKLKAAYFREARKKLVQKADHL